MKQKNLFRELTLGIMLIISITYSSAQISKIAIISLEDTTIVNKHVGFTILTNFTDTLNLNIAVKRHIEQQLIKNLSQKFEVSIINHLPDSIIYRQKTWGGMTKNFKNWITNMKGQYDLVIIIDNLTIPREMNMMVPNNTSGLYSGSKYMGLYTTITFLAYRTANLEELEYYNLGGKLITQLKTFKLPEDKRTFTPEMFVLIKDGFIKHLDSRVEHFLTKTYLMTQSDIDQIKANNP